MRRSIVTLAVLLGLINLAQPSAAQGQAWPSRPVKLILPLGPGSGTDTVARLFADRLATRWGKPVVIENKPGGDGIIAITAFLQANDDHTLLFTATSSFTGHPYLHDKLPYDPQALVPAARVCDTLVVLAVPESLNVKTVKELVDIARAQPGKLNAASITGLLDLVFNGFLKSANLDIPKVPYRDPVQALNDLAEGRIQMLMTSITIVRAQVQAGRVRMLALTNAKSSAIAPNIPSVVEAGFPDLNVDGLVGFFTTKDTPASVREQIANDVRAIVDADPQIAQRLAAAGQVVNPGSPAQFAAAIDEQKARAAAVGKLLDIKPAQF
jgi:tripartite-type tricarboxylate transporter receptor subunit TctC